MDILRRSGSITRFITHLSFQKSHTRLTSSLLDNLAFGGKFDAQTRADIEHLWKPLIQDYDQVQSRRTEGEKYYVLSMFPYPSGRLHMGHVRVYTISDAMARYQRMHGKKVIHPMGWDAFGLPAENAAIEHNVPPDKWTKSNVENMRSQLKHMCYSFDWDRELATCDPEYYKWTQHIFLQMFHKGLVYRRASRVNWDPVDQTVLADEQIDEDGRSWRSGAKVETRYLKQWYVRTTAYAKSLLDGLEEVNPDLWKDIIKMQKNWIGDCSGTKLDFTVKSSSGEPVDEVVTVFTSEPELIHGLGFICLHSDHPLNQDKYRQTGSDELTVKAVNPVTGVTVPILVIDDTTFLPHTLSKLGIPCSDARARTVATSRQLPVLEVLEGDKLVNSESWTGLTREEARKRALEHARTNGYGGHVTSARLNDWLISRQRFWGTPIPIIHCDTCGAVPVSYEDLPVKLPEVTSLTGKGESPLATDTGWKNVDCPNCGSPSRRETDTMDTFVDSSWYYLRYLDPHNYHRPFSEASASQMPVDLYIGGKEHATLHLYFARYFSHFLHGQGLVPCREPFHNLLTQGMVLGQSYRVKGTGRYLRPDQVDKTVTPPVEIGTGEAVVTLWEKMSKSKHNGTDPESVVAEHGVDSTRLCILGGVAPKSDRKWQPEFFKGILNWQSRVWVLVSDYIKARENAELHGKDDLCKLDGQEMTLEQYDELLFNQRNYCLNEYMFHMERTFMISTGISKLQAFTNQLKKVPSEVMGRSSEFSRCVSLLIMTLAPLSPMFASQLWAGMQKVENLDTSKDWSAGVLDQRWPDIDPDYNFPIYVRAGHDELFRAVAPYHTVPSLTPETVLALVRARPEYREFGDRLLGLRPHIQPLRIEVMTDLRRDDHGKKDKKKNKKR